MKNLFLLLAFCFALTAQAQEITETNLQGDWKICAFDINGIYWDFKSDTVKLPPELTATLGENQKEAMIADVREGLSVYKDGTIIIKTGNYIEQSMAGEVASGNYTIEKKDNLTFLNVVNHNATNTVETIGAKLVNGQLHISMPDEIGGTTILIYCK